MRRNRQIKTKEVRLINFNGEHEGVVSLDNALNEAKNYGLDLVEIQPNSNPPVCKVVDFGKLKYENAKKQKTQKKKTFNLKEIRLGKSLNIEQHDVNIKVSKIKKFLEKGHPVLVVQRFKQRENPKDGILRLNEIINSLSYICKIQNPPKIQRNIISVILSPKKEN